MSASGTNLPHQLYHGKLGLNQSSITTGNHISGCTGGVLLVILGVQSQLEGVAAPGVPFKVQYVPGATFQGNRHAVITASRPLAAAIHSVTAGLGEGWRSGQYLLQLQRLIRS
jgi:hypothetical protein